MEAEIVQDLITYFGDEVDETDVPLLTLIVKRIKHKVIMKRRYPTNYDTEQIEQDLQDNFYYLILDAAINSWSKRGAEGETSRTENGTSMSWEVEESWYYDIIPFVSFYKK